MPAKKSDPKRPWLAGDPERKVSLNVPFPEPLNLQMDYLLENKAIRSKSSFIRDAVAKAAEEEVQRLWHVQEAVRQMEQRKRPAKG